MKIIKEKDEKRSDYIFQKNDKTINGFLFITAVLFLLILGVIISGVILAYF